MAHALSYNVWCPGLCLCSSSMQETTEKEDPSSTAQPLQKQEEEGELQVGTQKEEPCEGDGSQMDTEQQPESKHHEHSGPENSKDCLDSSENVSDGTKNAKADNEEDSSVPERMEEGDSLQEKDSTTRKDVQPKTKTSCDVSEKSAAEADREDGSDDVSQVRSKHSLNSNCEGGGGSAASSSNSDRAQHRSADFLNALNLLPRKRPSEEHVEAEGSCSDSAKRTRTTNQNGKYSSSI